jgi:CO/xanthine dehydrogenase Mo-binding subunit
VTGGARYTADIALAGAMHATLVHSTIANGRAVLIDTTAAEQAPGVLAVLTHRNMPRMNATPKPWSHLHPHGQGYLPLQNDEIHYAGQPIALVVAATRDQAAHAGTLIKVEYEAKPPVVFDRQAAKDAVDPPQFLWPVASSVGDAAKGIAAAAVRIEQTYTTSDRHHNQMEPHATTAVWDAEGRLTLYETTQHIFGTKELVAIVLGVPPASSGAWDRRCSSSLTDPVLGRFLNRNYSGYLVPTSADIPELDVLFVGEFDAEASPLGAKGHGELTAVSVAPAIANAVYHATGKRLRDLPITMEKLF